jgi:plastocyanin
MSDLFYVFGIALVIAAVILSAVGLRSESFPASRGVLTAVLAAIAGLVVASCAFAIVLSEEEADERAEEVAEFEAEQADEEESLPPAEDANPAPAENEPVVETEPTQEKALALTSPEDGSLQFDPTSLEAPAGEVSVEYTNPSPVPHNVAIEAAGEVIAQGETVSGGDSGTATAQLEPGDYTYFCSIPGHREAGMEGTLTVD